jgi:AcrR family transcriptional regulator
MFADADLEDPRAARREATRERILQAAWDLARRDGLAAITLRQVARQVGMRAPSLYTYFESKNAMYDAMYAQAAQDLAATLARR